MMNPVYYSTNEEVKYKYFSVTMLGIYLGNEKIKNIANKFYIKLYEENCDSIEVIDSSQVEDSEFLNKIKLEILDWDFWKILKRYKLDEIVYSNVSESHYVIGIPMDYFYNNHKDMTFKDSVTFTRILLNKMFSDLKDEDIEYIELVYE